MSSNPAVVVLAIALKVSATCLALWIARGGVALLNMMLVMPRSDPLRNLPGPEGTALESHLHGVMECVRSSHHHRSPSMTHHISALAQVQRYMKPGRRSMERL